MPETMKIWTNVSQSAVFSLSATEAGTNNQYQILTRIIHSDQEVDRWSTDDLFTGKARLTLSKPGNWLVVVRPSFITSTTKIRFQAVVDNDPADAYNEVIEITDIPSHGLSLSFSITVV